MILSFKWFKKAAVARSDRAEDKIGNRAFSSLYRALLPLDVPGLHELECTLVYPAAKGATKPHVESVRYMPAKSTGLATLVRSPEVSFKDKRWENYRDGYVAELGGLFDQVLVTLEAKLRARGEQADLGAARAAASAALEELSREISLERGR